MEPFGKWPHNKTCLKTIVWICGLHAAAAANSVRRAFRCNGSSHWLPTYRPVMCVVSLFTYTCLLPFLIFSPLLPHSLSLSPHYECVFENWSPGSCQSWYHGWNEYLLGLGMFELSTFVFWPFTFGVFNWLSVVSWTLKRFKKGVWKSQKGSESEHWEDHVEKDHGELTELAPGLFQVSASYFTLEKYRNMTVLQLPGGGLLLHSPIALPEIAMAQLEQLGQPQYLLVPNGSASARVDVKVYQKRYPETKIICPESLKDVVEKHIHVDAMAEPELNALHPGYLFITPPLTDLKGTSK